jgi:hypothetical protein
MSCHGYCNNGTNRDRYCFDVCPRGVIRNDGVEITAPLFFFARGYAECLKNLLKIPEYIVYERNVEKV